MTDDLMKAESEVLGTAALDAAEGDFALAIALIGMALVEISTAPLFPRLACPPTDQPN